MERETRLSSLLASLDLPVEPAVLPSMLWFLDELLRWNRKVNLTAITDPDEAMEKHLVDALTVLPLLTGGERLLDLGSGGGFPGIPLKIARSSLRIVSVDAVGKKIAFQRHVGRQLAFEEFEAVQERAENLARRSGMAAGFDVVVSRAFASLTDFIRLALPFLAPHGALIAMKGPEGRQELAESSCYFSEAGLAEPEYREFRLPRSGAERVLILLRRKALPPQDVGGRGQATTGCR